MSHCIAVADNARWVIKSFWLWLLIITGLCGALLLVAVSRRIERLMGGMINAGGAAVVKKSAAIPH